MEIEPRREDSKYVYVFNNITTRIVECNFY